MGRAWEGVSCFALLSGTRILILASSLSGRGAPRLRGDGGGFLGITGPQIEIPYLYQDLPSDLPEQGHLDLGLDFRSRMPILKSAGHEWKVLVVNKKYSGKDPR